MQRVIFREREPAGFQITQCWNCGVSVASWGFVIFSPLGLVVIWTFFLCSNWPSGSQPPCSSCILFGGLCSQCHNERSAISELWFFGAFTCLMIEMASSEIWWCGLLSVSVCLSVFIGTGRQGWYDWGHYHDINNCEKMTSLLSCSILLFDCA